MYNMLYHTYIVGFILLKNTYYNTYLCNVIHIGQKVNVQNNVAETLNSEAQISFQRSVYINSSTSLLYVITTLK